MARAPRYIRAATHQGREPAMTLRMVLRMLTGRRETMLENRIIEMPFPMPNSVICSPSHMIRAEPEVKVRITTIAARAFFS